jgi:hypothetical protein
MRNKQLKKETRDKLGTVGKENKFPPPSPTIYDSK